MVLFMARIAYDSIGYSREKFITEEYIFSLLGEYFVRRGDYFLSESKSEDDAKGSVK